MQFLAPKHLHHSATKKHQFCPTFNETFSVTCFRARVLCFEFRLDRWVGCWTTPSPLRPSRLLRIDVRLLVAPQESLLPSLTFSSLFLPGSNTSADSHFSQVHFTRAQKIIEARCVSCVGLLPAPPQRRDGRPVRTACQPTLTWCRLEPGKAGSQPASQRETPRSSSCLAAAVRRTPQRRFGDKGDTIALQI